MERLLGGFECTIRFMSTNQIRYSTLLATVFGFISLRDGEEGGGMGEESTAEQ